MNETSHINNSTMQDKFQKRKPLFWKLNDVNEYVGVSAEEFSMTGWQQVVGCCAEPDSENGCGSVYNDD